MSQIKRRQFLQFAGSTLATLGLSQLDLQTAGNRYARVLAQSTPRKLALLVGISNYQASPLPGCVTDVNLQKQLLIHRFGFNSNDILVLTNEQATRQGILTAFKEHLIKQAKPGDVVVYHFSGHGSQVPDPDCDVRPDCLNSTFVPIDSSSLSELSGKGAPDIMGHTLFLLMYALETENVTVVLDSCHSGGGTRGNFRIRSIFNPASLKRTGESQSPAMKVEQEYQQQWLSQLGLSREKFIELRRKGVAKGAVIASAKSNQLAADVPFDGFNAGAFTYLMTQYLWQQIDSQPFARVVADVGRSTTRKSFTGQEPLIEYKPDRESEYRKSPVYFLNKQTPPAEAVITKVEGDRAELWLGGLDPDSLAAFKEGAILSAVDDRGSEKGRVELISRQGLVGTAKLLDAAQSGVFLQERSRSIPSDLTLKIGLDPSLGSDAATAKPALAAIGRIEAGTLQQQEVHYIFGRMTAAYRQQLQSAQVATLPDEGSLGLFLPGLELVPGSFGTKGETVTGAITRLQSKLNSLLAARIVKTALNTNSSRLNVTASMQLENAGQFIIGEQFTIRGSRGGTPSAQFRSPIPLEARKLPLKTPVQILVTNNEASNLYVSVLVIDPTGEISVVFPNQWSAQAEITLVGAGQTKKIPDSSDPFRLVTKEPKGVAEVLILASRTPLREALKALRDAAASRSAGNVPVPLRSSEAGQVVNKLLDDVTSGARGGTGNSTRSSSSDNASVSTKGDRSIETNQLAALSITFEVI